MPLSTIWRAILCYLAWKILTWHFAKLVYSGAYRERLGYLAYPGLQIAGGDTWKHGLAAILEVFHKFSSLKSLVITIFHQLIQPPGLPRLQVYLHFFQQNVKVLTINLHKIITITLLEDWVFLNTTMFKPLLHYYQFGGDNYLFNLYRDYTFALFGPWINPHYGQPGNRARDKRTRLLVVPIGQWTSILHTIVFLGFVIQFMLDRQGEYLGASVAAGMFIWFGCFWMFFTGLRKWHMAELEGMIPRWLGPGLSGWLEELELQLPPLEVQEEDELQEEDREDDVEQ